MRLSSTCVFEQEMGWACAMSSDNGVSSLAVDAEGQVTRFVIITLCVTG